LTSPRWTRALILLAFTACAAPAAQAPPATPTSAGATPGAAVSPGTPGTPGTPDAPVPTADPTTLALAKAFKLPAKGDPDAPLTIYAFSDYMCPFCRRFEEETFPELEKNYIDTGKASFAFVDFPLSNHGYPAVVAAEAAHCATAEDRFWEMHDALFAHQPNLGKLDLEDETAAREAIVAIGAGLGLDEAALAVCLETQRFRPIVASLAQKAQESQVNVTPTLLIGQEPVLGMVAYEDLVPILEKELARALGTPVPDDTPTALTPPP